MEKNIPWIGYQPSHYTKPILKDLTEIARVKVTRLDNADDGLENVINQRYPAIIVQDILTTDNPGILPREIARKNYPAIACYVIRTIKKSAMNKDTPVIVLGTFINGYNPEQKYTEAGADMAIDIAVDSRKAASKILKMLEKTKSTPFVASSQQRTF